MLSVGTYRPPLRVIESMGSVGNMRPQAELGYESQYHVHSPIVYSPTDSYYAHSINHIA